MSGSLYSQASADFKRVEEAIRFIEENFKLQPSLEQMARTVHLSKYHFDRLFKRWAGISPIQFMRFMTLQYTKERLSTSRSLMESAMNAGLSGTGRLHDLFVTFEGVTPGEFKRQGDGLRITYGFCDTPFGECLLATTERGICYLGFVGAEGRSTALRELADTWPGSERVEHLASVRLIVEQIFRSDNAKIPEPINLQVKGTNFQINVWKALLTIPEGCVVSYQDIGAQIGHPKAVRAVGNAVAMNPIGYLIPCHRVIASTGKINQYRWGSARKRAMIGREAAVTAIERLNQLG
ncbi:methylated-DNA--[protein]-cysteine S-methyltransferase [Marispirochaeta sp.]|jgi:AraC family transcriptional regulator, regulatory protein of adaptative response / methylated-DNA-[protein]-cysteine methyltransferase|uniref:bifunctional helix-turn-helix domain-containing protein/methylated-DNA--[protein]-cysteine S-methyltransferase n=1 Tax=Marispirochaeta sp. TaxID=2038653 RepID=UPI0029C8C2C3|nr:methylated-DNA--[protein]-cysteine S-methyltransferase [Marispirochaeta sp.]